MAAKDKAAKAAAAAQAAKENPYLQRVIQDDELRDNMVVAFEAARNAYSRLNKGKAPAKNLIEDKKLHADLKRSADALRDASSALREAPKHTTPKKKRKGGFGKLLLVAVIGGVVADRRVRGPAQQGARRALRCRGGVRLQLQHDARRSGGGGTRELTRRLAGSS